MFTQNACGRSSPGLFVILFIQNVFFTTHDNQFLARVQQELKFAYEAAVVNCSTVLSISITKGDDSHLCWRQICIFNVSRSKHVVAPSRSTRQQINVSETNLHTLTPGLLVGAGPDDALSPLSRFLGACHVVSPLVHLPLHAETENHLWSACSSVTVPLEKDTASFPEGSQDPLRSGKDPHETDQRIAHACLSCAFLHAGSHLYCMPIHKAIATSV